MHALCFVQKSPCIICVGRCTVSVCLPLPHDHLFYALCLSACVCVLCTCLHDNHHSPWLCAPPSPSSVSVRLLSIPALLQCSSSAAERCHRLSSLRLSLRSTHCDTATEIAGKQRRKYASRILLAPLRSSLPVGCTKRGSRRERRIFFSPL